MTVRTGIGWDVHPLVKNRPLVLGGVVFAGVEKGLDGHSDADVVCHAVCDALLGAMNMGDIGEKFPDSDPRYKDYSSVGFLEITGRWVKKNKYEISNIDCTVMSDAVRLGDKKREMSEVISKHIGIDSSKVSVKATTWEGRGAVGRGEVIACMAVATLISRVDAAGPFGPPAFNC